MTRFSWRNSFRLLVSIAFALLALRLQNWAEWAHEKDKEWYGSMVPVPPFRRKTIIEFIQQWDLLYDCTEYGTPFLRLRATGDLWEWL